MAAVRVNLSELSASSGKVKLFVKILNSPNPGEYVIADESDTKLFVLNSDFAGSKAALIIGKSVKILDPVLDSEKDCVMANSKTAIFVAPMLANVKEGTVIDELKNAIPLEETLSMNKNQVSN